MASRGSYSRKKYISDEEYRTEKIIGEKIKILEGLNGNHSLPDYSHSGGSIYAKLNHDGTLRQIRFYDDKCNPIIEIGYHPEHTINNGDRANRILHFHLYNGLERSKAMPITKEIKEKYNKYLKEFDLYD